MPDGGGAIRLKQRGAEFSIMLGATELMNSRLSGSEEALARLACERIGAKSSAHVMIGGLGMGFTLRAALAALPATARVTVAELVPAVVRWARGPMAELFGTCLDDPRVTVWEGDAGVLIKSSPAAWDAVLLDVDNGPEGLTRKANDRIYDPSVPRGFRHACRRPLPPSAIERNGDLGAACDGILAGPCRPCLSSPSPCRA